MKKNCVYIFLFITGFAIAQDPKIDFKKINEKYAQLTDMSFDVRYELFFDNNTKPSDKEEGFYKRSNEKYYVKNADNEVVINKKFIVMIDNESKVIIVDKSKQVNNPLNPLKLELDSVFHFYEKVVFYNAGVNKELNGYTFYLKGGPYTTIDVIFDSKDFIIKEIINVYREKMPDLDDVEKTAKLKISFSNFSSSPVLSQTFNEKKYVMSTKNGIKPTTTYSGYKLLTNLKKL